MAKAVKVQDALSALAEKHGWEFFVAGRGPGRRYIFRNMKERLKLRYSRGGGRREARVTFRVGMYIDAEVFYDVTFPDGPTIDGGPTAFIDALLPMLTRSKVIERHKRDKRAIIASRKRDVEMWVAYLDELDAAVREEKKGR